MIRTLFSIFLAAAFAWQAVPQEKGKAARFVVAPVQDLSGDLTGHQPEVLRARLEDALLATKVFEVDTRLGDEANMLLDEAQLARSFNQSTRSVDFLLVTYVDGFSQNREARRITAMPGRYNLSVEGDVAIRARVLSVRTGELKRSFELDEAYSERIGVISQAEIASRDTLRDSAAGYSLPSSDRDFVVLANLASKALAGRIYEDIYPAEVMLTKDDTVYISRGFEGGYAVGDIYKVFSGDGEELRHPVTGELLGTAETQLATVTITEVRDDFSIGTLDNVTGSVAAGALVRE